MATLNADRAWSHLGLISFLLHQAATQVWSDADQSAADSPLHDLGLGLYLAHHQASALLPDNYKLSDVDVDVDVDADDLEERTPLQLLTEAQELTRPLPLHLADLVHGSHLVVSLCDLIREARGLGY